MHEKTFQRHVLKRLRDKWAKHERRGLWIPYPRTRFANAGVSDLVLVTAAVELKAPGSRYDITPTQQAFLDELIKSGGVGQCVHNFEELGDFIYACTGILPEA